MRILPALAVFSLFTFVHCYTGTSEIEPPELQPEESPSHQFSELVESESTPQLKCPANPFDMYVITKDLINGAYGDIKQVALIHDGEQIFVLKRPHLAAGASIESFRQINLEISNQRMIQQQWGLEETLEFPIALSVCDYLPESEQGSNVPWISYKYFAEGDLFEYVQKAPMSFRQIRPIAIDILRALLIIHERGYVYRDLKAENVVLYKEKGILRAKIIDLSFMSSSEEISDFGTLSYMAPEIILTGTKWKNLFKTGTQVDMWSFGALLYFLRKRFYLFNLEKSTVNKCLKLISSFLAKDIKTSNKFTKQERRISLKYVSFLLKYGPTVPHAKSLKKLLGCNKVHDDYHECRDYADLISGLLRYHPNDRLTAQEALNHPFFTKARK